MADSVWAFTHNTGLPFPIRIGAPWDGVTYLGGNTSLGDPSNSELEQTLVYGNGTPYPIAVTKTELMEFLWRVKYARVEFAVSTPWEIEGEDPRDPTTFSGHFTLGIGGSVTELPPEAVAIELSPVGGRGSSEKAQLVPWQEINGGVGYLAGAYGSYYETEWSPSYLSHVFGETPAGVSIEYAIVPSSDPINIYTVTAGTYMTINGALRDASDPDIFWLGVVASVQAYEYTQTVWPCTTVKANPAYNNTELGEYALGQQVVGALTVGSSTCDLFCTSYTGGYGSGWPSASMSLDLTGTRFWPYAIRATQIDGTPHPYAGAPVWNAETGAQIRHPVTGVPL